MSIKYKGKTISGSGTGIPSGGKIGQSLTKKSDNDYDTKWENIGGEIYSIEETRIGTWIDGKPLYRKVYLATVPSDVYGADVIPSSNMPSNMDFSWVTGIVQNGVGTYFVPYVWSYNDSNQGDQNNYAVIYVHGVRKCITMRAVGIPVGKPVYCILYYTKTTDQTTVQVSDNSLKQEDRPSVEIPEFNTVAVTASAQHSTSERIDDH